MNTPTLIPVTGNALNDALLEYEAAHGVWMNTSVFTDAGKEAKRIKDAARAKYEAAYMSANPTHILL